MEQQILQPIGEIWRHRCATLEGALAETIGGLKDLLRLDEYHRHGHDPEQLQRALGPLAESSLDLGSLSRVLGQATRTRAMDPKRLQRVKKLIPALDEIKRAWSNAPVDGACVGLDEDEEEIRARAEKHLDGLVEVFRSLRIAQLEIRSKYQTETHDAMFANFDWRHLGPSELQLSPPFVVVGRLDGDRGGQLHKALALLETGMPINVLLLRASLRQTYAASSGTRVPAKMTVETLPLALRGAYLVQTHLRASDFQNQMAAALSAPRPTVISLLRPHEGEADDAFRDRAERAIRARAFPMFLYDPDRDARFVMCFDLSANPSPELAWTTETLTGLDAEGQPIEVVEAFTPAHLAAFDADLVTELSDLPPKADSLVPLTDYLGFSRRQQIGKLPFVSLRDDDGGIARKVVSARMALQCAERLHLWRTLQEISGFDNPYVSATRNDVQKELSVQREAQLESLRQEMEKDAARREKAAIATAVRKLVADLTGVKPSGN